MKPPRPVRSISMIAMAALLLMKAASAADIHVMISSGFHGAYSELGPAFERATGNHLITTRGPSMGDSPEAIPTRLSRGETADVVILDGGAADELGKRGLVQAESKIELAQSLIGMVVREGAEKPDISSVAAFRTRCCRPTPSPIRTAAAAHTCRPFCSRSWALPIRSRPRAGKYEDRRPASRSQPWWRAAKLKSASSRWRSSFMFAASASSARSRRRSSRCFPLSAS